MVLPIGIGLGEAQTISLKLDGHVLPRPLTHDLIVSMCSRLGAAIRQVVVNDIYKGTFYAQIYLERDGKEIILDSRPSDGVALALASGTPLYISEKVAKHSLPFEEILQNNSEFIFDDDEGDKPLH